MRRAARKDETQDAIVETLRAAGCLVKVLNDTPDLLISPPPYLEVVALEVGGVTKNRRRSPKQLEFLRLWNIRRVSTPQQAMRAVFGATAS